MLLHTVNKSPFERNSLESCLRVAEDGAGVLLIEDGVYAAMDNTIVADLIKKRMGNVKFYVLGPRCGRSWSRQSEHDRRC